MLFQVTVVMSKFTFELFISLMNWYHVLHIWILSSLHEMLLHTFSCHSCHHKIHIWTVNFIHFLITHALSCHRCNHKFTFEWFILFMNWYHMLFLVTAVIKNLIFEWFLFSMNWYHMLFHITAVITNFTFEWFLSLMNWY